MTSPTLPQTRRDAFAEAIAIVQAQRDLFKDPAYAGGPLGAFSEIFACNEVIGALLEACPEAEEVTRTHLLSLGEGM